MKKDYQREFASGIVACLEAIGLDSGDLDERLTNAYDGRGTRLFHNLKHAVHMSAPLEQQISASLSAKQDTPDRLNHLTRIAGAFHDAIYIPPDIGFGAMEHYLQPYILGSGPNPDGSYSYNPGAPMLEETSKDVSQLVFDIFGINPTLTDGLAKAGSNELLSALAMANALEKRGASKKDIAIMSTVIAGTIPFKDQSYFPTLRKRLQSASEKFDLSLGETEIKDVTRVATYMANRDMVNFASAAPNDVISGTVNLIPEQTPALKDGATLQQFINAHKGQLGFLAMLQSEQGLSYKNIFHTDGDVDAPYPADKKALDDIAKANIKGTATYLKWKIVSASIALAIADNQGISDQLLDDLFADIEIPEPNWAGIAEPEDGTLYHVFSSGRQNPRPGGFDIDKSPISAYLYPLVTKLDQQPELINELYDMAVKFNHTRAGQLETSQQAFTDIAFLREASKLVDSIALIGLSESFASNSQSIVEKLPLQAAFHRHPRTHWAKQEEKTTSPKGPALG